MAPDDANFIASARTDPRPAPTPEELIREWRKLKPQGTYDVAWHSNLMAACDLAERLLQEREEANQHVFLDRFERDNHAVALITLRNAQNDLADIRAKVESLYAAIEHGDSEHRAWLGRKLAEHFGVPNAQNRED